MMKIKFLNTVIATVSIVFSIPLIQAAEYQTTLHYDNVVDLTSPISGIIKSSAQTGRLYQKGEALIQFDDELINNEIALLKQQLKLEQLKFRESSKELQRSQELYEGTMLSDHDLKLAEIEHFKHQLGVKMIENKLASQLWEKKHYRLKAPVSGYVISTNSYSGQYVNNKLEASSLAQFATEESLQLSVTLNKSAYNELSLDSGQKDLKTLISYKSGKYPAKLISYRVSGEQIVLTLSLTAVENSIPEQGKEVIVEITPLNQ